MVRLLGGRMSRYIEAVGDPYRISIVGHFIDFLVVCYDHNGVPNEAF